MEGLALIRLFKNDPIVTKALATMTTICLSTPVIAELLFAARNSTYQKENLKIYNEFIDACNVLNITRETANYYSIIRFYCEI
ncbi:MAG: hypothetical protein HYV59_05840 [Planctomycetes bacterium]|nr:hypothetical protein [Planctomycetota bacterium]